MNKIGVFLILLALGCNPRQEVISETDAISTIEGFFDALDVENTDPELLDRYVTEDFLIYEAGKKMNKDEFVAFASVSDLVASDWELSDFRVSSDNNSAHVSLFNRGNFVAQSETGKIQYKYQWLESAFLVKEAGMLKIKFYFSDNIGMESDTIP
ncbi:MAG: nuclear transport factor 2 family protein [Robiginitalea sp.]|jgi:hypothetical protein